jgi:hypothetical protein
MERRVFGFRVVMASMALAACGRGGRPEKIADGGTSAIATNATTASTAVTEPALPRCKAEGLGAAKLVDPLKLPDSCHWRGLAHGSTTIMRSEADLAAGALDCTTSSGVDFAKNNVVVSGRSLSPATVGIDVYDDGKKLTFVSRQRGSCPNEYPPTPITIPLALLIPAGETRTFADAMCKQEYKCP